MENFFFCLTTLYVVKQNLDFSRQDFITKNARLGVALGLAALATGARRGQFSKALPAAGSDAERNRDRLLEVALRAFSLDGPT